MLLRHHLHSYSIATLTTSATTLHTTPLTPRRRLHRHRSPPPPAAFTIYGLG
nr:hypothetical protein [Tanacetum cinerariifolium]